MLMDIDYDPQQGRVTQAGAYRHFLPPSPLNYWVQSFWQLNVPSGQFSYRGVPDNCVDWIINLNNVEDNIIVPPFLSPIEFTLAGQVSYFGIRFRVLGHQSLISVPLGEWCLNNGVASAMDLLSNTLLHTAFERLERAQSFDERCKCLSTLLLSVVKRTTVDMRIAHYIRYCHRNTTSCINLSDQQCSEFGVSSRQLRRLTQLYLGTTPKDFARVLRFQRTLNIMDVDKKNVAWAAHYYDQSHYIREFKRLSGFTPTEFKNLSVLSNQRANG